MPTALTPTAPHTPPADRSTKRTPLSTRLMAFLPLGILSQVTVSPSTAGMPGANFLQQLLGWVAQISLWGCLLSILGGGAYWGLSQHGGNSYGASKGKMLVLGGAIGAAVCGGAAIIVNTLYGAAQS